MENLTIAQPVSQAYRLLKYTFVIVPIVAGLDKFTNLLTQWDQYLPKSLTGILPIPVSVFMMAIGVIEIIAGILVLKKTELGGYIVAVWLSLIGVSLLISMHAIDVAVRDLVMAVAAFAMARMTKFIS